MLKLKTEYLGTGTIDRYLASVQRKLNVNSPEMSKFATDLTQAVVDDNKDKVLYSGAMAGVDRFGLPLAPLGQWASKPGVMQRRGYGPVLAPHGASSRVIRDFATEVQRLGRQLILIAGWQGFVSSKGFSIMQAHIMGSRHLPVRDIGGIGPKGMEKIKTLFRKLRDDIARGDRS